ncbi:MAG: hypothetical protein H6825_09470 [Planctomycetes bacterium]|nr:hypothetical protein [Planctomycetota bacterium]
MNLLENFRRRTVMIPALVTGVALTLGTASAQYAERPALLGSGEAGVDVSGRSVKNKRVRAIHTTDDSLLGGTAYFYDKDPFLAYQLGRNLNFREFRKRDGVLSKLKVSNLIGPMPDGHTAKITANNATSCTVCHNQPYGTPGGGMNFAKDAGRGRNSPHYFGGGIMEMIALQIRADILNQLDSNQDGWVSIAESQAYSGNVKVRPTPGAPFIDFGSPQLTFGTTGVPDFNTILRVWYVDANGQELPQVTRVDGLNSVGYNFEFATFGWGQMPAGGEHGNFRAINPTLRAFYWDPHNAHAGLQAYDPTTMNDPNLDGISEPSLAGALQFPVTHRPPDLGIFVHPLGYSTTDPDSDGHFNEISEGDLDLAEWFMLNAPRPAFAGTQAEYDAGVLTMKNLGCTGCHIADWTIKAKSTVFAGDRRFFDFDVTWNDSEQRLEGKVVPLYTKVRDVYQRNFSTFDVHGFFTDMKQHDMGEGFKELGYDGVENTIWRTAPLWGVGSGFPWGHDGASMTLHDAIMRHDGDGAASKAAYAAASQATKDQLADFLGKLQLYDIESIPADIDGNDIIETNFLVAGVDTGVERFNAEWLFKVPVEVQGPALNADGETVMSFAGLNVPDAYGELLPYRMDTDSDGWPDVWDVQPTIPGYKDGVH